MADVNDNAAVEGRAGRPWERMRADPAHAILNLYGTAVAGCSPAQASGIKRFGAEEGSRKVPFWQFPVAH
jgi:hypothetical protein